MTVNEKLRRMIAQRASEDSLRETALASGMTSLGEDGLAKVKSGITTPEELLRVVTEVRELRTLCPGCGGAVSMDFMACPHCARRLNGGCAKCGRMLQPGWNFCPFCTASTAAPTGKAKRIKDQRRLELPSSNVKEFKKSEAAKS
jgi:hypothetical protein